MCQSFDVQPVFCWFLSLSGRFLFSSCVPKCITVFVRQDKRVGMWKLYLASLPIVYLPSSHSLTLLQSVALKAFRHFLFSVVSWFSSLFFVFLVFLPSFGWRRRARIWSTDQMSFQLTNQCASSVGFLTFLKSHRINAEVSLTWTIFFTIRSSGKPVHSTNRSQRHSGMSLKNLQSRDTFMNENPHNFTNHLHQSSMTTGKPDWIFPEKPGITFFGQMKL